MSQTSDSFERYGHQDLMLMTVQDQLDECEICHHTERGHWYEDNRLAGTQWFLCGDCVAKQRRQRYDREEAKKR